MSARLAPDDKPEVNGYWEWLLTPNLAAVGRLAFALLWVARVVLILRGTRGIVAANWGWPFAMLLIFGVGELALFVIFAVIVLYAMIPYHIYVYCHTKQIGWLGNIVFNVVAWYAAELFLDFSGALITGYFLD